MTVHSVSELNRYIAEALDDIFAARVVEGEVSEVKENAASGIWYFKLKDPRTPSVLSCMLFRTEAARVRPSLRLGERVRLHGAIKGYIPNGTYSFVTQRVERVGEGDLARRLAELRARLGAEGLFNPDKRRPLPRFPRAVGVATGRDSAALADMLRLIGDRSPATTIILAYCKVQGEGAAVDIARAIRWLGADPRVDVIIAGRGGGSAEDLFAFNEEVVVRAVAASPVPIISAVGHESDQCLADLAADWRAPTPSAAAKEVVADAHDIARGLDVTLDRLQGALQRILRRKREGLAALRLVHPRDRIERTRREANALAQRLDGAASRALTLPRARLTTVEARLAPAAVRRLTAGKDRLRAAETALGALSPVAVLDRGYAIVTTEPDVGAAHVVRDSAELVDGQGLSVRLARGTARVVVRRGV